MKIEAWVAVSFYTKDTVYEEIAKDLIQSAHHLDIVLKVYEYESRGSWNLNTHIKPECILRAMNEYPDKDIIFVDADAYFLQYPYLFNGYKYDMGVLWMYHKRSGNIVASNGTIFVKNTPEVKAVIQAWCEHVKANPSLAEQTEFEYFYKNNDLKVASTLPPEYCMVCIPDEFGNWQPIDKNTNYCDVVIRHGRSDNTMKKGVK